MNSNKTENTSQSYYAQRVLTTIFLVFLGIYLFLAISTYTPFDPGWTHVSSETQQVSNASGVVGAWLADILYGLIGWTALLVPIFLFLEAVQLWWPRSYLSPPFRYIAQFFLLLTTAGLLYFFWNVPNDNMVNSSGGILGYEIGKKLQALFTHYGAMAFLILFNFILWTLIYKIEWLKTKQTIINLPKYLEGLLYDEKLPTKISSSHKEELKHLETDTSTTQPQQTNAFAEEKSTVIDADHQSPVSDIAHFVHPHSENEQTIATHPQPEQIINTGEIWHVDHEMNGTTANTKQDDISYHQSSQQITPQQQFKNSEVMPDVVIDDAPVTTVFENHHLQREKQLDQQVQHDLADQQKAVDHTVETVHNQHYARNQELLDVNAQLILEADKHLQQQYPSVTRQQSHPQSQPIVEDVLDWSDNKVLDELIEDIPKDIVSDDIVYQQQADIYNELQHMDLSLHSDRIIDDMPKQQSTYTEDVDIDHVDAEVNVFDQLLQRRQQDAMANVQQNLDAVDETLDEFEQPWHDSNDHVISHAFETVKKRQNLSPLPELSLLDPVDPNKKVSFTAEQLARLSELLEIKLQDFQIKAKVKEVQPGPVVTRFELEPAPGVKVSKITNIARDLARSMVMPSVRVVEVIPGKPYIGIEVPNKEREIVRLIELLDVKEYRNPDNLLTVAMGKSISGTPVLTNLDKAPHMLVAGTTGSGKSVAVNAMLLSLLLKYTPQQLRLVMIDPKQLELANYNDIPHLLTPVITDMKDAANALNWCVNEMERRYTLMASLKVRKINDYNRKVREAQQRGEDLIDTTWKASDSATQERAPRLQELPMIVVVADEFADMMMQVGKKVEELIARLAQKARAAGIHLMLATQRPSVDVITGLIKANIPTRVALRVNSKIDSRTILDAGGAEDLLGHGDMLFLGPGKNEPERVHGAFISDDEVNRICDAWRERGDPNYIDDILTPYDEEASSSYDQENSNPNRDILYDQCVAFVLETRKTSVSSLQRKFSLGYSRAARIIDQMEEQGIVSEGTNGKREILV